MSSYTRIIHEFSGKHPQATGIGKAYRGPCKDPPVWRGMRFEGMVIDVTQPKFDAEGKETSPLFEGVCLEVEGDADSIRTALKELLAVIDLQEEWEKERFAEIAARTVKCNSCGSYVDPIGDYHGHGDGQGNHCSLPPEQAVAWPTGYAG